MNTENITGERIKTARKRMFPKMTQAKLAEAVGVSPQLIAKYENGTITNYNNKTLQAIAKQLNVTIPYLAGYTDKPISITEIKDAFEDITPELSNKAKLMYELSKVNGLNQNDFIILLNRVLEKIDYNDTKLVEFTSIIRSLINMNFK